MWAFLEQQAVQSRTTLPKKTFPTLRTSYLEIRGTIFLSIIVGNENGKAFSEFRIASYYYFIEVRKPRGSRAYHL